MADDQAAGELRGQPGHRRGSSERECTQRANREAVQRLPSWPSQPPHDHGGDDHEQHPDGGDGDSRLDKMVQSKTHAHRNVVVAGHQSAGDQNPDPAQRSAQQCGTHQCDRGDVQVDL